MASLAHLRGEEKVGLGVAVVAHIALFGVLLWHSQRAPSIIPPADRMTVSLASDVSLESTAPKPSDAGQAAVAPELSPVPEPLPAPMTVEIPPPPEQTIAQKSPNPPKPKATTAPKPVAKPIETSRSKPEPKSTSKKATGSLLGNDFLKGVSDKESADKGAPAANFGPAEAASLGQAIARQLKPYWQAPQGPDVEKLVAIVRFRLNPDGSLAGRPELISMTGKTAINEAQAGRYFEQAVRAIRLAAPFDLPPEFYDKWKTVTSRFDRRL